MFFHSSLQGEPDDGEIATGPERRFPGNKPGHTIMFHNEMDQERAHGRIYTVAYHLLN